MVEDAGSKGKAKAMRSLSIRVTLVPGGKIGPGKVALLEHIAETGSISAGARAMKMSYKRAWDLVDDLNRLFGKPVVSTQSGGNMGGGAMLTPTGLAIIEGFRAIEKTAEEATLEHVAQLIAEIDHPRE